MQSNVLVLAVIFALAACSSHKDNVTVSQEEAPKLDKQLNVNTGDAHEKVGIKDNTVKIQKVVFLEEEMRRLQTDIDDLESNMYGESVRDPGGLYIDLQRCRKRLSDPRISGNGTPEPMEKWEKISQRDEDFNYHVDRDKNVVAVSEEELGGRIGNLKKLKRVLRDKYENLRTKLDSCENRYHTTLINHGLDPADTKAVGEWVDGPNGTRVWKMRKASTTDPEELMRRKQQRERQTASESPEGR